MNPSGLLGLAAGLAAGALMFAGVGWAFFAHARRGPFGCRGPGPGGFYVIAAAFAAGALYLLALALAVVDGYRQLPAPVSAEVGVRHLAAALLTVAAVAGGSYPAYRLLRWLQSSAEPAQVHYPDGTDLTDADLTEALARFSIQAYATEAAVQLVLASGVCPAGLARAGFIDVSATGARVDWPAVVRTIDNSLDEDLPFDGLSRNSHSGALLHLAGGLASGVPVNVDRDLCGLDDAGLTTLLAVVARLHCQRSWPKPASLPVHARADQLLVDAREALATLGPSLSERETPGRPFARPGRAGAQREVTR